MTATPSSSNRRIANRVSAHLLAGFLVIALVAGFALENSQRVAVDYLGVTHESRLAYVIFASAVVGALADRLFVRRGR